MEKAEGERARMRAATARLLERADELERRADEEATQVQWTRVCVFARARALAFSMPPKEPRTKQSSVVVFRPAGPGHPSPSPQTPNIVTSTVRKSPTRTCMSCAEGGV